MKDTSTQHSAVNKLIAGYQQFQQNPEQQQLAQDLSLGQSPKIMVIACSDSRVDPSILFNCGRGELFVVRNVANLVPPNEAKPEHHSTSAALEFAVKGLGVTDIVILGHSKCGGIQALMSPDSAEDPMKLIKPWVNVAMSAKHRVEQNYADASKEQQLHQCERASLLVSLENLKSFSWIKDRVEQGVLSLHAWHFDIATNNVECYQESSDSFIALADVK